LQHNQSGHSKDLNNDAPLADDFSSFVVHCV
jgi:hypothetical protein